jgi:hypothetical protein
MSRIKTLQALFKRYRRPGDIVFAWGFLALSVFLLWHLSDQTAWRKGGKLFAQPRFWPAVSLGAMTGFALLHLLGSALSERIYGRWKEVMTWLSAVEFALWFIGYAFVVPYLGYLPATLGFALILTFRMGYRSRAALLGAGAAAIAIVLIFKTFLQVKLPAGQIYNALPDGLRQIMLTYF